MLLNFGFSKPLSLNNIKAVVDTDFLTIIHQLDSVKEVNVPFPENNNVSQYQFDNVYNDGLDALEKYAESTEFDPVSLQTAAEKFSQALEISKNHAEPYFYLAYIFNHLKYKDLAIKYYEIAKLINPKLKGLKSLTKYINGN